MHQAEIACYLTNISMTHTNLEGLIVPIRPPSLVDGPILTYKQHLSSSSMSPKKSVKKSFREAGVQVRQSSQDRGVQVEEAIVS
jgi:hypothetical protein